MVRARLLLWTAAAVGANEAHDWVVRDPATLRCGTHEFLDTIDLVCAPCALMGDANLVRDPRQVDHHGNALGCRCPVGFVQALDVATCTTDGTCEAMRCSQCPVTSLSDSSICTVGETACAAHHRLVERDASGNVVTNYCESCPPGQFVITSSAHVSGKFYAGSPYVCQTCPDVDMAYSAAEKACVCETGARVGVAAVGAQHCVDATHHDDTVSLYPESSAANVAFRNIQTKHDGDASGVDYVQSVLHQHYFLEAATRCRYHDNTKVSDDACQVLANLCVLTQYDLSSTACEAYHDIAAGRPATNNLGAHKQLPWLAYTRDGGVQVRDGLSLRKDASVQMQLSFDAADEAEKHKLRFRLASYAMNGTFLGMEALSTQLAYCGLKEPRTGSGGGPASDTSWLRYGYSVRHNFKCDLTLLQRKDPVFHELYLVDTVRAGCSSYEGEAKPECLVPIPVLNKALKSRDAQGVNKNGKTEDGEDDIFVRRFVLWDSLSGRDAAYYEGQALALLRYAVEIQLRIVAMTTPRANRIYTPILEIKYRERKRQDMEEGYKMDQSKVEFEVEYSMSSSRFWRAGKGFAWFFIVFVGLWWLWSVGQYQRRNHATDSANMPSNGLTLGYLFNILLLLGRLFVHVFFPLCFCLCSYWFVFFKLQKTAYALLPTENRHDGKDFEYWPVRTLIITLWVTQTLVVARLVYRQCSNEIVFIDWEPARAPDPAHPFPVSAWRSIFVANEWAELQTTRRTSVHFILFWLGFLLVGLGLEHNATSRPRLDRDDFTPGHHNIALRFVNTTFFWLGLALIQWLWNYLIYQRFVSEPEAQSFVDVCTVAKVSVLILDAEYHGWYVHGDAAYEHADDTMAQLSNHLLEDTGASARLVPDMPEATVFQLWLSPAFRRAWRNVQEKVMDNTLDLPDPDADVAAREYAKSLQKRNSRRKGPATEADERRRERMQAMEVAKRTRANASMPPLGQARLGRRNIFGGSDLQEKARKIQGVGKVGAFVRTFLQHGFAESHGLDWHAQRPDALDRILEKGPPPTQDGAVILQPDRSWFFGDGDLQFTQCIFLGHDWELLVQEMLTFAVADIWFRNTTLSIFLVFLLHHFIRLVCERGATRNIADSSMVDERFLI